MANFVSSLMYRVEDALSEGPRLSEDTQKLEKAGYAKPFQWQATWREQLDGVLQLDPSFWRDPDAGGSAGVRLVLSCTKFDLF